MLARATAEFEGCKETATTWEQFMAALDRRHMCLAPWYELTWHRLVVLPGPRACMHDSARLTYHPAEWQPPVGPRRAWLRAECANLSKP